MLRMTEEVEVRARLEKREWAGGMLHQAWTLTTSQAHALWQRRSKSTWGTCSSHLSTKWCGVCLGWDPQEEVDQERAGQGRGPAGVQPESDPRGPPEQKQHQSRGHQSGLRWGLQEGRRARAGVVASTHPAMEGAGL